MRPLRLLLVLLLIGGGVGASLLFVSKAARSLHGSPLFHISPPARTTGRPGTRPSGGTGRRRSRRASGRRPAPQHPAPRRPAANPAPTRLRRHSGGGLSHVSGLERGADRRAGDRGGVLLIGLLLLVFVLRRLRRRSRREYELYELHLSTHDQAKPQDLEDMVESIANIVRALPADRVRHGQPYVALELICGARRERATPRSGVVDQRSLRAAAGRGARRRDQRRLPRRPARPRPRRARPARAPGALREPGYVMRFRKERSFVYSLIADGDELASRRSSRSPARRSSRRSRRSCASS